MGLRGLGRTGGGASEAYFYNSKSTVSIYLYDVIHMIFYMILT